MSGEVRIVDQAGRPLPILADSSANRLPILVIGGDHPYSQWWGTNGQNGMAQMYLDRGITPYIAINADSANGPGATDMMTWAQCAALQARGVEFVSHGYWHVDKWNRINTGIRVEYIGTNASATVQVQTAVPSTAIVCTSAAPSSDSVTSTFASDTTLSAVKTTLEANGKWRVTLDPILTGLESSTYLLGMNAARDVLASSRNTYFAASGGFELRYADTNPPTYSTHVWARRNSSANFTIFMDGVVIYNHTGSTGSLATLISNVNAIAGAEFTALACDDGYTENNTKPTYFIGDELETNLKQSTYQEFNSRPTVMEAGLPQWYVIDRHMQYTKDLAAANGVTLKHFAQSGGNFYPWMTNHSQYGMYRGNPLWRSNAPPVMRRDKIKDFVTHRALTNAESGATYWPENILALVNAMCGDAQTYNLEPWVFVALMHALKADGTSGYAISNTSSVYYDQYEADWLAFLNRVKSKVDAGLLQTMTFEQLRKLERSPAPNNLFFNPAFESGGASRMPATSGSDGGFVVPGWSLVRASTMSTMSIANGVMSLVNSSATATEFLNQEIELVPGRSYEISAYLDVTSYTSGAGLQWSIQAMHGNVKSLIAPTTNWKFTGPQTFQSGLVSMRVAIPPALGWTPPVVRAGYITQTMTFSSSSGLLATYATDIASLSPIRFSSTANLPTGLSLYTTYWTIRVSATTCRFATSLANAIAATAIAFTDAGTGTISGLYVPATYDLSVNKNIKVNVLGVGLTGDIDCSGGTAAATTAKEIAAKINAAIVADANYLTKVEYHNIASVVDGVLTLTAPYIGTDQATSLTVSAGSSASAVTAIFGNATVDGRSQYLSNPTSEGFIFRVALRSALQGAFTVQRPTCRDVEYN